MKFNTLAKSLDIIDLLMKMRVEMNVTDISKTLKMPKSTTYKYLAILRDRGYLEYESESGMYNLGMKFLQLASVVQLQSKLDKIALPYMRKLYLEVKETIILSVLRNGKAVCLERVEGEGGIVFSMQRGAHLPLHCGASAKVLLAFADEDIESILGDSKLEKHTPNTITNLKSLKDHLEEIRKAGYAYSDQEVDFGARAVSAPIFDHHDKLVGGLCIAGPMHRFSDKNLVHLKSAVIKYSTMISGELKIKLIE